MIDAGFSAREIEKRLQQVGFSLREINAIVVTHEHSDHIKGIEVISRKTGVAIYVSSRAVSSPKFEKVGNIKEFETGVPIVIDDFELCPFSVPHDTIDPVGFSIRCGTKKLGLATDFGIITNLIRERLKKSDALLLEFNHDRRMLMNGPYPWYLKQRIMGTKGHHSNEDSATLLRELLHEGLKEVFLAHVSCTNNSYDIPYLAAKKITREHPEINIQVCRQNKPTPLISI